ncbi:putative BTB POZ domain-containing protein [Rosellinia necatrix]|uniref:Putative BTB POZ domain-containing protein n=1 Tax=Rosellinia necatrix TaxID=77044 RepID=A0A1W2TG44_ROSNE|nr:putative BTB POZ domain-containing protein [Rosellinia necatrix]
MTSLWKYFWENDVDNFCRLLAPAGHSQTPSKSTGPGPGVGSLGALGSSPHSVTKSRKASGLGAGFSGARSSSGNLGKAEINSRDYCGLTLLLRAASSTSPDAVAFAQALLDHPAIDIYVQDPESGWNALHRALYNGNISIARLLLAKERRDLSESFGPSTTKIGQLIKTKDHEGNSPFDLYNATIALRSLKTAEERPRSGNESDTDEAGGSHDIQYPVRSPGLGEEVFTFGSNNNLSLGVGHKDDRQYPEQIYLERPDRLIHHLYDQQLLKQRHSLIKEDTSSRDLVDIPALVQNHPLVIQDVALSKFHSAILTTDPFSNLYVSGLGRGGRLGLGDENTKLGFVSVQGGLADKRVTAVALGQNHTLAVTSEGELWSWGSNYYSQLGYLLPLPIKSDEEPISITPRQVFGPLKKEMILGVATSSIHSVVHTGSSLFCWGKNVGQLGLMDADSRSLEVQTIPRKVAATLISSHSSVVSAISAIDRATCCLFGDRSLVIFTSYGYKTINLHTAATFTNSSLQQSMKFSSASSYDFKHREIHQIASGGDTIAVVTGSGDLFTMQLNHDSEHDQLNASTTNPSKIKDAITTPQCIWNSRKDSVKSVGVGENGSVIISTLSGAVWRRIRRTKARDTKSLGPFEHKRKDFKFQRVPYITDVTAVRSSIFGAYAAVRRDCGVTREQLEISQPTLWDDVSSLLPLHGFKARNSIERENKDTWKFANAEKLKEQADDLSYEILTSTDLEDDLASHFTDRAFTNGDLGVAVRSASNPQLSLPVHSWILSARSAILRLGLQRFRETGHYDMPDLFIITEERGQIIIEFAWNIDIIALLNIVVYMYGDRVIPAWNFTRQASPLAHRYRQIRTDVMKLATRLGMPRLEAIARMQTAPTRSMNRDFEDAVNDLAFFEDGDALLELDGDEIPVHSAMLCQRCPWFQGLFNGRSGGKWLESRRAAQNDSDLVKIDLRHMNPESFHYVLQYLYADIGEELFDSVVANSIDEFSELVMDVLGIANELMLDRLSQICQSILGRFVSTRNISTLLNLISPCYVTEFKEKGLEYICLQMESLLENHLLDELDEELLHDLDDVVRDNQLARCPFARSGRAELLLHEQNPDLAHDMHEERRVRVRDMAYKASLKDDERKTSSYKARFGSFEELSGASPAADRAARQKSKVTRNAPFSPDLRPKTSQVDLMFSMDGDEDLGERSPPSPSPRPMAIRDRDQFDRLPPLPMPQPSPQESIALGTPEITFKLPRQASRPSPLAPSFPDDPAQERTTQGANPWGSSALPISRLDLREVLAESKPAHSALSAGLEAQTREGNSKLTPQKLSQKERKKQLQQQAEQAAIQEADARQQSQQPWSTASDSRGAPWKKTRPEFTTSTSHLRPDSASNVGTPNPNPLIATDFSSGKSVARRAASPDTRFPGQKLSDGPKLSPASTGVNSHSQSITPHSKSYIKRVPKPAQESGLPFADIIGQQQREQQNHREAVAKRSLQEIQQEQEFQEWWDQESRRTQEEEARRIAREENKDKKKDGGRRSRGSNKPRGGARGGNGKTGTGGGAAAMPDTSSSSSRGKIRANRGKS